MISVNITNAGLLAVALCLIPVNPASASSAPWDSLNASGDPWRQEEKASQPDDKRSEALKKYLEAQRLEQANNFTGAVDAYREAIELDPDSAELRIALGSLFLRNRNVIEAEKQAREAMRLAPANLDSRKLLARVFLAQTFVGTSVNRENAEAAIKELEAVAKAEPAAKIEVGDQELPVLSVIGELYLQLEDEDKALDALKRVSDGDSSSDRAHYRLALLYFQKNKIREASAAAQKAYDINPESPLYAGLMAKVMLRMGRTQEAIDIYRKALDIKDEEPKEGEGGRPLLGSPLLFDYAEALVSAGKYEEATKLVEPIIKAVRRDHASYLSAVKVTVDALRRSGKRDEAVRTLEEALKGQDVSESLPVLFSLAETYEEMQQFDKAIGIYEEALSAIVNPDGTVSSRGLDKQNAGVILRRIALAYRMDGKREESMGTFERMRKVLGEDSHLPDQLIIDTLLNDGKSKEALEKAQQAAVRYPEERVFKFYRAQAAGKLGDLETAESIMRSQLKGNPEDADVYSFLSYVQLEANELNEAETSVRKAIQLDPRDISPLITLSTIQERQKKYKDSEATLRKALEIDPDNATVLNNLGYFLADRNERLDESEQLIRRAVNIEPTNGSYLDSLGWVLFRRGKLDEAAKFLEQAVIYSPRSATIHDHLGDLYKKQGQVDKAKAKWEEALKLATDPEEIKRIKQKLGRK